MFILRSFVD